MQHITTILTIQGSFDSHQAANSLLDNGHEALSRRCDIIYTMIAAPGYDAPGDSYRVALSIGKNSPRAAIEIAEKLLAIGAKTVREAGALISWTAPAA